MHHDRYFAAPVRRAALMALAAAAAGVMAAPSAGAVKIPPYLSLFNAVSTVASTVPPNGDLNPYGVATVPQSLGTLVAGDTLVSNFNASSNLQGTGTTIVQISPGGAQSVFAQLDAANLPGECPGGVGLTTALSVLAGGFVVVGSLPVTDAGAGTPQAGCLIVINRWGVPVETWSGADINGPWDMTAAESPGLAVLFVTNVLNGTVAAAGQPVDGGTVLRLDIALAPGHNPALLSTTVIGSGFPEELNSAALVLGPTGVGLGLNGNLYVADTVGNRVAVITQAATRTTPATNGGATLTSDGSLNQPLGLTMAPDGDVVTANGGDGNAVETTPQGKQVDTVQLDPAGAGGDLFGLTTEPDGRGILFVDDGDNTLKLFHHQSKAPGGVPIV